ncbi:MAG: choice-of-anchor Q domain-containing protein [Pseudomonadota bacterium]
MKWILALTIVVLGVTCQAATLTVNTLADSETNGDGLCSLREALASVTVADVRQTSCVAQGAFGPEDSVLLTGLSGVLLVDSSLSFGTGGTDVEIVGPGDDLLSVEPSTIGYPVLTFSAGVIEVRDLTFSNAGSGALTVQPGANVTIIRGRFLNNQNSFTQAGGAISSLGSSEVRSSFFQGNGANQGGAIYLDGQGGAVLSSTFVGNSAGFAGGAIFVRNGLVVLRNNTVVGNSAGSSGSGLRFGGGPVEPTVFIDNNTITGNTGAAQVVASDDSQVLIRRSILADGANNCNTGTGATITIDASSIDENGSCGGAPVAQVNPLLTNLADFGGPVPTRALGLGSPALDRTDDCGGISEDARGLRRPSEGDGQPPARCDVGAYEEQGSNIFAFTQNYLGTGLTASLSGGSAVAVAANGPTYLGSLPAGLSYTFDIGGRVVSPSQSCTAQSSGGVAGSEDITVLVTCTTDTFTVGGVVSGLEGTGLSLALNGADTLNVASNGTFVFATALDDFQPYAVTIGSQPDNPDQLCSVTGGTGTLNGSNLTSVQVDCQRVVDLSISKDDGRAFFTAGETLSYTIAVTNSGDTNVQSARVIDTLPVGVSQANWICTPGSGAACAASGSGSIDELIDLDAGATAVFTLNALTDPSYRGRLINIAEVFAPATQLELSLGDNNAEDETATGQVFSGSFEDELGLLARKIDEMTR